MHLLCSALCCLALPTLPAAKGGLPGALDGVGGRATGRRASSPAPGSPARCAACPAGGSAGLLPAAVLLVHLLCLLLGLQGGLDGVQLAAVLPPRIRLHNGPGVVPADHAAALRLHRRRHAPRLSQVLAGHVGQLGHVPGRAGASRERSWRLPLGVMGAFPRPWEGEAERRGCMAGTCASRVVGAGRPRQELIQPMDSMCAKSRPAKASTCPRSCPTHACGSARARHATDGMLSLHLPRQPNSAAPQSHFLMNTPSGSWSATCLEGEYTLPGRAEGSVGSHHDEHAARQATQAHQCRQPN